MKQKRFAFLVVGALIGFVLGFFVGRLATSSTQVPTRSAEASNLPEGHPPVDFLERLRELEQHAAEHPEHVEVRVQIGNAYFEIQQYQMAATWYERALQLDPSNVDVNNNLGTALFGAREVDRSIEVLGRSLELQHDHPVALQNLGWVYFSTNRHGKAVDFWERLIRFHPNYENVEAVKEHLKTARSIVDGEHS